MIAPMKKLLLAGRAGDRPEILRILQEEGVIHVEPARDEVPPVSPELLKEIERGTKALEILERFSPGEGTLSPPGTPSRLIDEVHAEAVLLYRLESDKAALQAEIERVAVWGGLALPDLVEVRKAGLQVELFTCPAGFEGQIVAEVRRTLVTKDGLSYVVAAGRTPIQETPPVQRFPWPERDAFTLREALETLLEEEKEHRSTLRNLAKRGGDIHLFVTELRERKRFVEVESALHEEGPLFVLKGWLPARVEIGTLRQRLVQGRCEVAVEATDPADDEMPPTLRENPWWAQPIEWLVKFLGVSAGYREPDISPYFLPFLTLFTAMLVADAGYALVALALMLGGYSRLVARGLPRNMIHLLCALMAGTFVYGVLTNSWFSEPLPWYRAPLSDADFLKRMCFFIAAVHLSIAHVWKIQRAPLTLASLAEVGWIIFIWAMRDMVNVLVVSDPAPGRMMPMFEVSLALVLFFTAPSWNLFSCVGQGLGAIALNAAAFLSDIISYIRLWAVGLAGGILGHSFNLMAGDLPWVIMVPVLIAAHLMNFALCAVAILAHGVRLNLLEFSNHLGMEWSGREYDPFRKTDA